MSEAKPDVGRPGAVRCAVDSTSTSSYRYPLAIRFLAERLSQ